jgi:hypothetical protein
MKHTPGPWMIVRYGDGDSLVVHSNEDNRVCFMATPGSLGDPAMIEADANLIAAAPDLLNGCNALLGLLQLICGRDDILPEIRDHLTNSHRIDEAKAAVAKATGESK